MADGFKPNIYPIMYWGLMYGVIAGFLLFVIQFLSNFITVIWFPVFLAGLIWGGYRNYQKQKRASGQPAAAQSPVTEFREAAQDIVTATREMINEQVADAQATPQEEIEADVPVQEETPEVPVTPAPEQQPQAPQAPPPPTSEEGADGNQQIR